MNSPRKPEDKRTERPCSYCGKVVLMRDKQQFCSDSCRAGSHQANAKAALLARISSLETENAELRRQLGK